jgi:hypothetical protein
MPSFQRLKHPFRRPTHYYTIHEPSPTPKQLERQREKERQRAHDRIENDLDDGRVGPRSGDSPDELPVIIDRGPYRGHIYPREQLFFNSIMLASDVEPIYAGPPGGELRQEVHRTPIRRPKMQGEQTLPPRPVPSEYLTASQNKEKWRKWEERKNKTTAFGQTQHPRPVPSEYLTSAQNAENLRQWEERSGRTPTIRREQAPERRTSPPVHSSPPTEPITPGTSQWDSFMDFPADNTKHVHSDGNVIKDESTPVHNLPATTILAEPLPLTASFEAAVGSTTRNNLSPSPPHTDSPRTQAQARPSTGVPGPFSNGTEQPELLTWNTALGSILRNEAIDRGTRTRIRERMERRSTTVAAGHMNARPVAMTDASLVPSFSYPIAGSEFHDRLDSGQTSPSQLLGSDVGNEEQLPNSVRSGQDHQSNSRRSLYRSPTPNNWPLRGGNAESPVQLTNGVPPGYYPTSSSSSGQSSNDARQHPPLPPDRVPEHVFALLCSLLTPSELALHYDVVQDSAPPHLPPLPALLPSNNAASTIPVEMRLVQKLHGALHGLQDRVMGVEEDLIPELSTHLEQKHLQIRELDKENFGLQDEIIELKRIADFSTKIIVGCWEREWEVWRTLLDVQRRRGVLRSPFARIFSRALAAKTQDDVLLDFLKPEGYVAQPLPSGRATQGPLKKKELDALLLMAKQNVSVLIEDLGTMKGLVEAYEKGNKVEDEEVLPVEGSWRDV